MNRHPLAQVTVDNPQRGADVGPGQVKIISTFKSG
jgi:hypothetical protein